MRTGYISLQSRLAIVLCLTVPVVLTGAQRPSPKNVDPRSANALFDAGQLQDIWIHVNARDWEQLRTSYKENTYYPADIEWRGIRVRNAGIRSRGRTSRSEQKPGLRIDFNRYVSGQEFLGLKSLVLDNLWQDASMMRERLAMQVFQRMGLPAPRESHARVFVKSDGEYAGVYGVVEVVDKNFLERNFGENDGFLYEYQWKDPYRFDFVRPDLEWYAARFEPKTHESAATSTLFDPIRDLVQVINDADPSMLEETLSPYLDVRKYITHVAIENVLSEPDGLLGGLGMNNFYLYRFEANTRSQLIVWDQDLAFEWLETPPPTHNFDTNVLAAKIWGHPGLRAFYLQTLLEVADVIGPEPWASPEACAASPAAGCGWLDQEILREYAQIRESALADPYKPHTNEQFEETVEFLRRFARERSALVRASVAELAREVAAEARRTHGAVVRSSGRLPTRRLPAPTR